NREVAAGRAVQVIDADIYRRRSIPDENIYPAVGIIADQVRRDGVEGDKTAVGRNIGVNAGPFWFLTQGVGANSLDGIRLAVKEINIQIVTVYFSTGQVIGKRAKGYKPAIG